MKCWRIENKEWNLKAMLVKHNQLMFKNYKNYRKKERKNWNKIEKWQKRQIGKNKKN
jgi:inorganic pyrophosphatase